MGVFSKSCEYGLKAVIYIATQSLDQKRMIKVGEIAKNSGLPEAFTAKLLRILTKYGIIQSQTGPNGGFYLDLETMNHVKLSQIVQAIDGDSVYKGCGLGLNQCDEKNPCPLHEHFVSIRTQLSNMLENTSIHDLALKVRSGETVLIR